MSEIDYSWCIWPAHWAGGICSVQVDGVNTMWIQGTSGSPDGIVARLEPAGGRITGLVMRRARLMAASPEYFRLAQEMRDKLADLSGDVRLCRDDRVACAALARRADKLSKKVLQ